MQAQHEMPKTLAQAKDLIRSLRARLGGSKPIPKVDPQPTGGDRPIAPLPQDPHPILPGREPPINPDNHRMDLGVLPPKKLGEFLECCSTVVLKKLLSVETAKPGKEQDSAVVQKLYRELKKRGI